MLNLYKGVRNLFKSGSRTVTAAQLPAFMAARTHCVCIEGLQVAVSARNCGSALDGFSYPCKSSSFAVRSEAEEQTNKRQNKRKDAKNE